MSSQSQSNAILIVGIGVGQIVLLSLGYWLGNLWIFGGAALLALAASIVLANIFGSRESKLMQAVFNLRDHKEDRNPEFLGQASQYGPLAKAFAEVLDYSLKRRELYHEATAAVGSPFMMTDAKGSITHASNSMLKLINKNLKDVLGQSAGMALYNRPGESLTERVIRERKPYDSETELKLWDGRVVPVKVFISCIFSETSKEVLGAVASFIDLSEIRAQQLEIEKQQAQSVELGREISDLAQRVASASEELSASADEQARGAKLQKSQTDSVATSMSEMTSTVMEVARNASETSNAADAASRSAREGVSLVRQAISGVNQVADSADKLALVLTQLDSQAGEIGRIIGVINDIADQTNLLALNAAIEAARAGEAGRGFAVVADEVRKLAEKTMTATKEVETAILEIQNRSQHAVKSMRETETQVRESTEFSSKAGESLEDILKKIEDMVLRITQIATASEEQSAAAEEVNRSIEDIAHIAHEADEGAGQAASATRDLASLAQELLTVSMNFSGSGKKKGQLQLSGSESRMKGVLPKLMQDYLTDKYGKNVSHKVMESLGDPVFLPTADYPDAVLLRMSEEASKLAGVSSRDILKGLGKYTVPGFHRMYGRYFKAKSLKEFYLKMNDVHAQLTKDHPGIKPPRFDYEDKGDVLVMTYHSKRGLFDYFEGILLSAADFFKQNVKVELKPLDKESAKAVITFLN